jgi:hypothetical protein
MNDESRPSREQPRPMAWVALAVSTAVAVLIWLVGTLPTPTFYYDWFHYNPFPELAFVALAVVVAAVLDIAAALRGRNNRIIALIAFVMLLAPIAFSLFGSYLP